MTLFKNLRHSTQKGAALMVALMFLVVLTMLGLAAIRATTQQTRMAAAAQFQISAFQAAEAAIRLVLSEIYAASGNSIASILTNAANGTSQTRTPNFGSGAVVSSSATLTFKSACSGNIIAGESLSSSFDNCCFDIDASSTYGSTSASSVQQQRVSIRCPSQAL